MRQRSRHQIWCTMAQRTKKPFVGEHASGHAGLGTTSKDRSVLTWGSESRGPARALRGRALICCMQQACIVPQGVVWRTIKACEGLAQKVLLTDLCIRIHSRLTGPRGGGGLPSTCIGPQVHSSPSSGVPGACHPGGHSPPRPPNLNTLTLTLTSSLVPSHNAQLGAVRRGETKNAPIVTNLFLKPQTSAQSEVSAGTPTQSLVANPHKSGQRGALALFHSRFYHHMLSG